MSDLFRQYGAGTWGVTLVKAQLMPVNPQNATSQSEGNVLTTANAGAAEFYLNPESWTEEKTANWVKHEVPGLSDPIQQWVSSGARIIRFQALITKDTSDKSYSTEEKESAVSSPTGSGGFMTKLAKVAGKIAGISAPTEMQKAMFEAQQLNLGITDKLNFYRSLLYPRTYSGKGSKVLPPYPVRLLVGSTFGERTKGALFVVDRLEIQITKQLPDLTPIEAVASFSLTELVDSVLSADTNIFTGYTNG